jgi:hypothetical protein
MHNEADLQLHLKNYRNGFSTVDKAVKVNIRKRKFLCFENSSRVVKNRHKLVATELLPGWSGGARKAEKRQRSRLTG